MKGWKEKMNIYLNTGSLDIPKNETCYIIAKNGIYLKKKLDLIESLTPVNKISFLEDLDSFAKLDVPKISSKMFISILGFFKKVYEVYGSEASVLIFYNRENKVYKVYVPEQEVSPGSLNYQANKVIKNHLLIGTIHSHGSMRAFHSSNDVLDEKNFDGLHITIGNLGANNKIFDICTSVVVNGFRTEVPSETYIEGIEAREYSPYFPSMFKPKFKIIDRKKIYSNNVKFSRGYTLIEYPDNFIVNDQWMKKVKLKVNNTKYFYEKDGFDPLISNQYDSNFYTNYNTYSQENKNFNPCETCIYKNYKFNEEKMNNQNSFDNKNDILVIDDFT